jgi:polyphosphate glucokinase
MALKSGAPGNRATKKDFSRRCTPPKVLMVDVGGSNVKLMASGQDEVRKVKSGRRMTAVEMVKGVLAATKDWDYDVISLGFPGLIRDGQVTRNPLNLGGGWEGFDFENAFKCPVRIINDAAMQALAAYERGRLLFVGFGTSIGACLIADDVVVPVEVGLMRLSRSQAFMDRLRKEALARWGRGRWRKGVEQALALLRDLFWPEHVVIGGGNAKYLDPLPEGCTRASNKDAFRGALRLWPGADLLAVPQVTTWRIERPAAG